MFKNIKLTPAQQLILYALVSLAGTALVGAISATYQYYDQHGLNIGELINFMLLTFIVLFGKALHDYVPGHVQDVIKAWQDTAAQAQDALRQAFDHIDYLQQQQEPQPLQASLVVPQSQQGPLVVIHAAAPITTPVSQTADTQPSAALPADPLADPPALAHVTGPLPGTSISYTGTAPAGTSVTVDTGLSAAPDNGQDDTLTHVQVARAKGQ